MPKYCRHSRAFGIALNLLHDSHRAKATRSGQPVHGIAGYQTLQCFDVHHLALEFEVSDI